MVEINNKTKSRIDLNMVRAAADFFLKYHDIGRKEVSIAFVGDRAMKKLNRQYRGLDCPTDVLSFAGEDDFLGEIIIDYAQIKKQAKQYSHSLREELVMILVHGLLHLLGYNDETENKRLRMIAKGEKIIEEFKSTGKVKI
jgi:probable rRNA maturation factor